MNSVLPAILIVVFCCCSELLGLVFFTVLPARRYSRRSTRGERIHSSLRPRASSLIPLVSCIFARIDCSLFAFFRLFSRGADFVRGLRLFRGPQADFTPMALLVPFQSLPDSLEASRAIASEAQGSPFLQHGNGRRNIAYGGACLSHSISFHDSAMSRPGRLNGFGRTTSDAGLSLCSLAWKSDPFRVPRPGIPLVPRRGRFNGFGRTNSRSGFPFDCLGLENMSLACGPARFVLDCSTYPFQWLRSYHFRRGLLPSFRRIKVVFLPSCFPGRIPGSILFNGFGRTTSGAGLPLCSSARKSGSLRADRLGSPLIPRLGRFNGFVRTIPVAGFCFGSAG